MPIKKGIMKMNPKRTLMLVCTLLLISSVIAVAPVFAENNGCVTCHRGLDGEAQKVVTQWETSIHKAEGIYCQDCHGGNPLVDDDMDKAMYQAKGFIGKPSKKAVPELCAKCHSDTVRMRKYNVRTDQYDQYKTSIHGIQLEKGDTNVAVCSNCHGAHDIKKVNDPGSSVYYTNVPDTCGKCHADSQLMSKYGIKAEQLALYKEGYHGQILYGKVKDKNPALVPNCATCHGTHGATPPGVKDVAEVCGSCHGTVLDKFREGPHYAALQKNGSPKCYDCHGSHKNKMLAPEMFQGVESGHCGACHQGNDIQQLAKDIYAVILDTKGEVDRANKEVLSIEYSGRNNQDIEDLMNEAGTYYKEIGPLTHSLNLEKINELKTKITANTDKVQQTVSEFKQGLDMRKKNLVYYLVIIVLIVILLYAKLRVVTDEYERTAKKKS